MLKCNKFTKVAALSCSSNRSIITERLSRNYPSRISRVTAPSWDSTSTCCQLWIWPLCKMLTRPRKYSLSSLTWWTSLRKCPSHPKSPPSSRCTTQPKMASKLTCSLNLSDVVLKRVNSKSSFSVPERSNPNRPPGSSPALSVKTFTSLSPNHWIRVMMRAPSKCCMHTCGNLRTIKTLQKWNLLDKTQDVVSSSPLRPAMS